MMPYACLDPLPPRGLKSDWRREWNCDSQIADAKADLEAKIAAKMEDVKKAKANMVSIPQPVRLPGSCIRHRA
jgi:hypothetical protein